MPEPRGKFLYDIVAAQLTAQTSDISALGSRAKDLVGIATVSTTITGALANTNLVNVNKHGINLFVLTLLVIGLVGVFVAGFLALKPRSWYLAPDAEKVAVEAVHAHPDWTTDTYYAQVAMGFLKQDLIKPGKTALQVNALQLNRMRVCVQVQLFGLSLLACAGLLMVRQAL